MIRKIARATFTATLLIPLLVGIPEAAAQEAVETTYQHAGVQITAKELEGKTIHLALAYLGPAPDAYVTVYKNSKIKVKDRFFVVHGDPATKEANPNVGSYAISFPADQAKDLMNLQSGDVVEVWGTLDLTKFGMGPVATPGVHIRAERFAKAAAPAPTVAAEPEPAAPSDAPSAE